MIFELHSTITTPLEILRIIYGVVVKPTLNDIYSYIQLTYSCFRSEDIKERKK